jgi:peptide/nickel transport system ATP-binding protein
MTGDTLKDSVAESASQQPADSAHQAPQAALRIEHLDVEFPVNGARLRAVSDVSLHVGENETLGVVGESGCGKSSLARAIIQVPPPTAGSVWFDGQDLTTLHGDDLRRLRPRLQLLLQDPSSSLNPRQTVWNSVAAPLRTWKRGTRAEQDARVDEVLSQVGIDPARARRSRPAEYSGGQCQRINLARALALRPEVLICDEVVSALDVLIQAQILNLLEDIRDLYGLTMIFIGHDLAVVRRVSDRIAIMYLGKLCEVGPTQAIFDRPAHPYTRRLLASIPAIEHGADRTRDHPAPAGEPPSPLRLPSGCRFRTLCPKAQPRCAEEEPQMRATTDGHLVACHFPIQPVAQSSG